MKLKRILSGLLAAALLLALLPVLSLPARAANTVVYTRYSGPEVAILNYYTGYNPDFYQSILKDKRYNAVEAGKFGDLRYSYKNGKNVTFTWSNFVDTRLAFLSDQTHQLKVNYATTLQNNIHEHSWKPHWYSKATQTCYGYMSAQLWFAGADARGMNGPHYSAQYSDSSKDEYVRKGDMDYTSLPEVFDGKRTADYYMINGQYIYDWARRSDLFLTFTNRNYYYDGGNKTCSCGGWADKHFVGFFDGDAPYVKSVETRKNGVATTDFKPGDTVQVVLKLSEPIRFADDSAAGKDSVYIGLLVNGSASDPLWARLAKLEDSGYSYATHDPFQVYYAVWELTFEYEIPADVSGLVNVTGIDLTRAPSGGTALIHSEADITLKQLAGETAFAVSKPSSASSREGFDRAKSYVTDYAGNSLKKTSPGVNFTIDTEQPYVAQTVMNASLSGDSTTHLGVGSSFSLSLYMNEVIHFDTESTNYRDYVGTATLNLFRADGTPVTVPVYRARNAEASTVGSEYGLGASGGYVSLLVSDKVQIQAGDYLPAGQSKIVVTGTSFDPAKNVQDASGNPAQNETAEDNRGHLAPTMGYILDVTGPAVTLESAVQNAVNEPFYVPFKVEDEVGGSGAQGMSGSVTLTSSAGEKSAFQYAVTGSPVTDGKTQWQDGAFGNAISFVQSGAQQYLHIRPVADVVYNFSGLTADFTLSDSAGNRVKRTLTLTGASFDNVGPTLTASAATRAYDNANARGVMTVPVAARDSSGISSFACLWADADAEISGESAGWEALTLTQGDTDVSATVTVTVPNLDAFSGTLWLKAEDAAGNTTVAKKGAYSYNLKALQYHIEYTTEVTAEAEIKTFNDTITQSDGVLIFDVIYKTEDDTDVHYINVCMQGGLNNGLGSIFTGGFSWYKAALTEDGSGNRTFTLLPDQDDGIGLSYLLEGYSGEIEVTVYSGTASTADAPGTAGGYTSTEGSITGLYYHNTTYGIRWWYNSQHTPISMDGSVGVEQFTLRAVPKSDNWLRNADNARFRCEFTYVDPRLHTSNPAFSPANIDLSPDSVFGYYGTNKSLAGAVISFKLTDTYGWDFDDIDWANSYLCLSNHWGDWMGEDTVVELRLCGIGTGAEQTVVIPATEIPSGRYKNIRLVLARYSAPDAPYWWYVRDDVTQQGYAQYIISGVNLDVDIDTTEAGSLEPGLLSFQPYFKHLNSRSTSIDMEMNEQDFPRRLIQYDANDVIYIPAGSGRVDMMFQVLDPEGNPALRKGYVTDRVMNFGQYDVVAWNTADPDSLAYLQSRSEVIPPYSGYFSKDYNENYCFRLNSEGEIERWTNAGEEGGQLCLTFTMGDRNTVYDFYGGYARQLRLTPDVDNVIAVQARYVNGGKSDIVYLTVHPVSPAELHGAVTVEPAPEDEDENHPWGTIVGTPGEVAFRYTPAEGESTAGLTFYLCEGYSYFLDDEIDGIGYSSGSHLVAVNSPVEMTLQGDGSYLAFVPDQGIDLVDSQGGLRHYLVLAQDAMGNLTVLPGPQNSVLIDSNGPRVDGEFNPEYTGSGFALQYYINDETLMACVSRWSAAVPTGGPLTLTFSVDEAYADLIGAGSFTVTYDPAEAEKTGTVTYENGTWKKTVVTRLPVEGNGLGISAVTATLETEHGISLVYGMNQNADLTIEVEGGFSPALETATDVTITLTVTDRYGNSAYTLYSNIDGVVGEPETFPSSTSITVENAVGTVPHLVSAEYKLTGNTVDGYQQDRALYMTFSGPVQPVSSWICPNPSGYGTVWADAFPITKDGEWEISYYDVSGQLRTEMVTLTDVFGEYGIDLEFSTLDYTTEPIVITANLEGPDGDGTRDCLNIQPYPADGQSYTTEKYGYSGFEYTAEQNGAFVVIRAPYSGNPGVNFTDLSFRRQYADYLIIHLDNYVNGRPEETVTLYFADNGRAYVAGADGQRTGTTEDAVTVSYRTGRTTQPVGDGDTSRTFRAGEDDSYSFTYYDPITDAEYTISGSLSALGVTLAAPEEPEADTLAPTINRVTVWRQLGSRFEQAEAFRGDASAADIAAVFGEDRTGYVAAYNLVVNADDASPWKLLLCDSEPMALTYETASAEIEGVSLRGNNLLLTPELSANEFWLAAVDSANNFSFLRLDRSWLRFDNTPPELVAAGPVTTGFTQRTFFLKATDDHTTSEGITFTGQGVVPNDGSNSAYPASEWPYMLVFTSNTTIPVTVTDLTGNSSTRSLTVEGLDFTAPILTVTWSPCFSDETGLYQSMAPTKTVNIEVVAHITSTKPIKSVEGTLSVTNPDYDFGGATPLLTEEDRWFSSSCPYVYYYLADTQVDVHFEDSHTYVYYNGNRQYFPLAYEVNLTVTALNGATASTTLNLGSGVVDVDMPFQDYGYYSNGQFYYDSYGMNGYQTVTPLTREGFTVPYALEYRLFDPNEEVFCLDGPKPDMLYSAAAPFVLTFTDNEPQQLTFADKAGNVNTILVTPDRPVDSTAPTLRVAVADDADATNAAVTVSVTASEDCVLTCADSGLSCSALTRGTDTEGNEIWTGTVTAAKNGTFRLTATDAAGNEARATFTVNNIDRTLPTVRFTTSTVSLRQDSAPADLTALLDAGVILWDNVEVVTSTLGYDASGVDLTLPGVYTVEYTVEDTAGNIGSAVRYVRVIDKNQLTVTLDGAMTELNGTATLKLGDHVLSVGGLKEDGEPYTVRLVRGIRAAGQMKRIIDPVPVAEDGSFTLSETGFYTLYITTQSRQTYRTLIYAEN